MPQNSQTRKTASSGGKAEFSPARPEFACDSHFSAVAGRGRRSWPKASTDTLQKMDLISMVVDSIHGRARGMDAILASCSHACIARIGWRIDPRHSGNNLLAALDRHQARDGRFRASELSRPACSFMDDDSNAGGGHDFASIVAALRHTFQRHDWIIETTCDYLHDQRLVVGGALVPALSKRLPALKQVD